MPLVSVIIPAHNPGPYLREAITSVHAQSFAEWELVVVDDKSSQDLSWISHEFPRARYLRQAHGGASIARNNGILNTTGELIAFMDQDDLWRPDKLRRQVEAMAREPEAALCYCDLQVIRADERMGSAGGSTPGGDTAGHVELDGTTTAGELGLLQSLRHFSQRFVVPSTVLIRRSALATSGLLDPLIPFSGDYDLLIKLGSKHKVIRVPSCDVFYRKHENNFSDQYEVGQREVKMLIMKYVAYAKSKGYRRLAEEAPKLLARPRRMYAAQAFDCARNSFRHRRYRELVYHWVRAVYLSPSYSLGSSMRWLIARPSSSNER